MARKDRKGKKMIAEKLTWSSVRKYFGVSGNAERDEQVEIELEKLVGIIKKVVPSLTEVRVFGSYNNGNWNPEKSDIDIYVEMRNEDLSFYKDRTEIKDSWFYGSEESGQRKEIRKNIREKFNTMNPTYKDRFSIHLLTRGDLDKMWNMDEGKGPIGKNVKQGRLLYSNKQIPITN